MRMARKQTVTKYYKKYNRKALKWQILNITGLGNSYKVKVKVKNADVEHARVEFSLVNFPREERKEKSAEQKQKAGRKRNGRRNQNRRHK